MDGSLLLVYRGRCAPQPVAATATPNPQMLPPGMQSEISEIVAILAGMFLEKQWEVAQ